MKPKFLFLIDSLSTGGAQRQMINLTLGLTLSGYQIEIFCYAPGNLLARQLNDAGIKIHYFLKSSRFSPDVLLAINNIINKGHFNLILSFLTTPNFYAILAGRIFRLKRIPVIVSERFCDLPGGVGQVELFSRQFYRFANHVVTNSHHQRINLSKKYPWLKNRISTIYNGYDLNYFTPAEAEPDNHPLKILTIASVSPYKNGLCLVEALNILNSNSQVCPQVDWIGEMVMRGVRLNYLNSMKQAIVNYGLENNWQWLNQRLDIVDQLHQHDFLVHPSYGEGLPNVVCEALACARPVIIGNTLDHAQLIQDEKSGYLFDYRDPKDLAEKIQILSTLPSDQRRQMGQYGRKYAEEYLSLKRFVDEYESLFLNLLN